LKTNKDIFPAARIGIDRSTGATANPISTTALQAIGAY